MNTVTTLTEAEVRNLIQTAVNGGLESFKDFLKTLDPKEIIDPGSNCSCFMHRYFVHLYPYGSFIIMPTTVEERTSGTYVDELPDWYEAFQRRAMNENATYHGGMGLQVSEGIEIVDDFLENGIDDRDLYDPEDDDEWSDDDDENYYDDES